uniref:Uncharacterized protein n=1 Tax=Leersia perrieri TaxID=77586 RepID=A0A0D9VC08_9ORYZ
MAQGGKEDGDGLEVLIRGLTLSEEEKGGLKGTWRSESSSAGKMQQAVGKLFSSKLVFVDGMVQTLGKI